MFDTLPSCDAIACTPATVVYADVAHLEITSSKALVMDPDSMSNRLFGRYQALRLYSAVARFAKPEFSTGQLARLTDLPTPVCSKELSRLAAMKLLRVVSRRGLYERNDESCFWRVMDELAREWGL